MKRILWFSIGLLALSGLFIFLKLNSPFGWAFTVNSMVFLLAIASLAFTSGFYLKKSHSLILRILSVFPFLISLLLVLLVVIGAFDYRMLLPGISQPNAQTWKGDYTFLKAKMLEHPAFKDSLSETLLDEPHPDFDSLTDDESLVVLMKLMGKLPDGHSYIHPLQPVVQSKFFPLTGYWFDDGYFIVRASDEYKFLEGARLRKINETTVDDLLEKINQLTGPENRWQGLSQFDLFVFSANVLHGLGVINSNSTCTITTEKNGNTIETTIASESFIRWFFWALRPTHSIQTSPALMNLRKPNFDVQFDSISKTLHLTFNLIKNDSESSITQVRKSLETFLERHPQKIIIDLRNCSGGDNTLYNDIIKALANFPNKSIYVLAGRKTFSAAVNFISELKKAMPIKLVGEPTGAGPNHYGDANHFLSPGGVSGFLSTKSWIFDAEDKNNHYTPDIKVNYRHADFNQPNDPWLDSIR